MQILEMNSLLKVIEVTPPPLVPGYDVVLLR